MSQEIQAIDLTLEVSDDDDSTPIYLSSSESTPYRPSSPDLNEIEVIESPFKKAIPGQVRKRPKRRVVRSPEPDASGSLPHRSDLLFEMGVAGSSTGNVVAEGSLMGNTFTTSTPKSSRPRPKRRVRPPWDDADAADVLDADVNRSDFTATQPASPVRKANVARNREASTIGDGDTANTGERVRKKRHRVLDYGSTAELLNRKNGIPTPTPRSTSAELAAVSHSTPAVQDASTRVGTRSRRKSQGGREAEETAERPQTNIASSESPRKWSRSSEFEDVTDERSAGRDRGGDKRVKRVFNGTPNSTSLARKSPPARLHLPELEAELDRTPTAESVPSRMSLRTKRASQRAIEAQAAALSPSFDVHPTSSQLTLESTTAAPPMRASSIASIASPTSASIREFFSIMNWEQERKQPEGGGQESLDVTVVAHGMADSLPRVAETPEKEDDWYILPTAETPDTAKRDRKRTSPVPPTPVSATRSQRRVTVSNVAEDTSETVRRGSRERKASEAMKVYAEQSGPRFSKRLSQKKLPASSGLRLPTPPPLESWNDVPQSARASPLSSVRMESPLPVNAPSGFSLPTVPWHPPIQSAPSPSNVNTTRASRTRAIAQGNSTVPATPSPAVPSAPPSRDSNQTTVEPEDVEAIPFPPCSIEEGENEFFTMSDFQDDRLMAAFAALDTSGNKAMSADEIAELCMERGWLSKSLGANAAACISNTLRSYQRRCQSTSAPARKTVLARQILYGGFSEAYLLSGLHPGMLAKLSKSSKGRPRGSFWYLEGWYGSARWKSPFAGLEPAVACAETEERPPKQNVDPLSPARRSVGRPRKTSQVATSLLSPTITPRPATKTPGLRLRLNVGKTTTPEKVAPSARRITQSRVASKIPPKQVPIIPEQERLSDESGEEMSSSGSSDTGSESTFAARRFDYVSNFMSDIESDANSDADSDLDDSVISTDSSSLITQSERHSVEAFAGSSQQKASSNSTIYVSMSTSANGAIFPDNPLGPVTWENGTRAPFDIYTFDDASVGDISYGVFDGDVDMQEPDGVSGVYQTLAPSSATRSVSPRIPWLEDRTFFREPPELLDGDLDSPATSPESCIDPHDDDSLQVDHGIRIGPIDDLEETSDGSLVNAVEMLRELLPVGSSLSSSLTRNLTLRTSLSDALEENKQTSRSLRISSKDLSKISFALPSSSLASPSSSPSTASHFGSIGSASTSWDPIPTASPYKSSAKDELHDDFDLVPGLQEQMSQIDIDCQEVCGFDETDNYGRVSDEVKDVHRLLFEKVNSTFDPTSMLGPESVELAELDDAWGTGAGTTSVELLPYRSLLDGSGAATLTKLACSEMETGASNRPVAPITAVTREPTESGESYRVLEEATKKSDMRMMIDEEDQIGIKEVDDAMLCSWVEEDHLSDMAEDFSSLSEHDTVSAPFSRDPSAETETGLESVSNGQTCPESIPIAVNPQVLGIVRPESRLPATLPTAPRISPSMTANPAWKQGRYLPQGSKAVPPHAIRPRAMVKCMPAVQTRTVSGTDSQKTAAGREDVKRSPRNGRIDGNRELEPATITVDNIAVFAMFWKGVLLLRRIDSDYINVTTLCRSLAKPGLVEEFKGLPGCAEVRGNKHLIVNGFWVHLSLVTAKATVLEMPDKLARVLLHPNLVERFPDLLQTFAAFRAMVKGLPRFGAPFGFNFEKILPPTQATSTTAGTVSGVPRANTQQNRALTSDAASPAAGRPSGQPQASTTPLKRPSPPVLPSQPELAEPQSKRQKSTDPSTITTRTVRMSRNVRPIIPLGVTTTQGASPFNFNLHRPVEPANVST